MDFLQGIPCYLMEIMVKPHQFFYGTEKKLGVKMKRIIYLLLSIMILPTIGSAVNGQSDENWTIAPTQKRIIKSEILGRNIRLQIGLPEKYGDENQSYGIIYHLDDFAWGGTLRETAYFLQGSEEMPMLITVGIDLEVENLEEWNEHRSYILTPTKSDCAEKDWGILESWTGGGHQFLKSLKEEIIPFIDAEYNTKPGDRTIVGHSFGGLFALFALFEAPKMFSRYLVSSPSLPWDDRVIFKMESAYAKKSSELPAKVFLSVGSLEDLPEDMMVHHLRELATILRLRKFAGLDITSIVFDDETHDSVTPSAFSKGLRALYSTELTTSGDR